MCSIGFAKQVFVSFFLNKRNHLSILIIAFQAEVDFPLIMSQTEDGEIKLKLIISSVFFGDSNCQIYWRCASFACIDWYWNLLITNLDIFSRRQSFAMSSKLQWYRASPSLLPNHFQQQVYCHWATWLPMQIPLLHQFLSFVSPSSLRWLLFL